MESNCSIGCVQLKTICNFFEWVNAQLVNLMALNLHVITSAVEEELRRRIVNLKNKILSDRTRGNTLECLVFFTLTVTCVSYVYSLVNCYYRS